MASSRRSSLPFTTILLHNAVLDRNLVPTDRSMVYLPCLHVTGHIPFASGANVNIRFLLHNAVLHTKLVPTNSSMVYFALSSRHWPHSLCKRGKRKHTLSPSQRRPSQKTGSHRPFDMFDGLNALSSRHWPHSLCKRGKYNIRFRNDLRVHTWKRLPHARPGDLPGPCVYCSSRLLASGTNILETLAFPRCFCFICQQRHRLRRAGIVLLFAAHFCLPVCASFCSIVFSTLLCVRRGFLHLGDILFSFPFSFHDGSPTISHRPHRPLPSRCCLPVYHVHLQALRWSFLFRSLVCDVLPSALLPSFGALLFSIPFSFRDGIPDIGNGACLFFFRCPPRIHNILI